MEQSISTSILYAATFVGIMSVFGAMAVGYAINTRQARKGERSGPAVIQSQEPSPALAEAPEEKLESLEEQTVKSVQREVIEIPVKRSGRNSKISREVQPRSDAHHKKKLRLKKSNKGSHGIEKSEKKRKVKAKKVLEEDLIPEGRIEYPKWNRSGNLVIANMLLLQSPC